MIENRNQIKTRMLKNAARAWGYSETEAESKFDPLVAMLLSACSVELEKISGEVYSTRARVLERLVQLLSPDVLTGALPAHAVASAQPVEESTELAAHAQLYTQRKSASPAATETTERNDCYFTPTASFPLNKASIRFMAAGNQLYRMNTTGTKEVIAHSDAGKELPSSTLWLGIDEPLVHLDRTLFYFDFRNEADKQLFVHHLPKASWQINGQPLQHLPGYGKEISGERLPVHDILNREHDRNGKIKEHINAFYKPFFVTLSDEEGASIQKDKVHHLPSAISTAFSGKESKLLQQQPLRWISIKFPETVCNKLLQDVVCVMNCFPVMNSRLHEVHYRLQDVVNIIPLKTDDLFLDLEEVCDDEGKSLNVRSGEGEDANAVLMRTGGVGRFDERDAASLVSYLLQLLKDDSAAFSTLGNEFMTGELKSLQQSMNKLEQRLFARRLHQEQTPYLIIRNQQKKKIGHNLFIRYWSTNGKEANHIKAGTSLQLYKGGSLENNRAVLVTTTQGGRNKLNTTESVLAYKSALLSRDRLITQEDIKAFCRYQLGERVKNVQVQKGVAIHPGGQQGFTRTIDVEIEVDKKAYHQMQENDELAFWEANLKLWIEEKSAALFPYRVFINSAA